eukprot:677357-Rhodomonas_salina.1
MGRGGGGGGRYNQDGRRSAERGGGFDHYRDGGGGSADGRGVKRGRDERDWSRGRREGVGCSRCHCGELADRDSDESNRTSVPS